MNKDMCVLVTCFEREIGTPQFFNTYAEAQEAMKSELLESMGGSFDDYMIDDDYYYDDNCSAAWCNRGGDNYDLSIFMLSDIIKPKQDIMLHNSLGYVNRNSYLQCADVSSMILDIAQEAMRLHVEYKDSTSDFDYVEFSNHLCRFTQATMNYADAMIRDIREYYKEYLHNSKHDLENNPTRKDENNA